MNAGRPQSPAEKRTAPLPLTVLGGFLGAGKTTLVNHLLRQAGGRRLAVLVNDFGDLPIDADLIRTRTPDLITVAGGCVCCSYGSDLVRGLNTLAAMRPAPDHVLLEASGVAIPGAIAATVGLLQAYRLDGIVVLADAETLPDLAQDRYMGDTVRRQLADADLLLLNKVDLVDDDMRSARRRWLTQNYPDLRILDTARADLPPDVVLGTGPNPPSDRDTRQPATGETAHLPIQVQVLDIAAAADAAALAQALAEPALGLIRAKGFVKGADGTRQLVQVVGRRASCTATDADGSDGIVCLGIAGRTDWAALQRLADNLAGPG
ncbi:CobW family GTP-binding protein [Sedimentitalea sp. HM32M-2]|uniref:CobW family GTP-binding protein n=1 Tax=Sedimentitalea sp. HM32M-2 TaxID=3351566 RepID=UPI0036344CD6